jgi:hypothetical protein
LILLFTLVWARLRYPRVHLCSRMRLNLPQPGRTATAMLELRRGVAGHGLSCSAAKGELARAREQLARVREQLHG